MTRTRNSIRNTTFALTISLITILIGLVAQKVFLKTMGTEYLGINGLFTSVVSLLGLAELGMGSAIYYHLYKPVAEGDTAKVKSLVDFYKIGYRVVAAAVFVLGFCLLPFLSRIVGHVNISESIYIVYLLFLIDIVFSYLLTYKRSVLYVDQNNHIISTIHLGYLFALNAFQIAALIITGNFYLYLVIKIFMRLVENVALTIITNRKYPYLKDKAVEKLDSATKKDVYKKIRGLSFHKVGTYVVIGTDNIIISIFFGVATVGLYSNYLLVISAIGMLMTQAFTAITASVGNLLVTAKNNKSFEVYKKLRFGNFWLSCFAATSILVIMNSFITLWVGKQYLLTLGVLIALSINLYSSLIRSTISSFKDAAGIYHIDRYVPVVESIANIVFAILFIKILGLAGVFIGTICSTLILHLFSYPKYVYKPLFKQSYRLYYLAFLKNLIIALIVGGVTFAISRSVAVNGKLSTFIANVLICLIVPNLMLYIIFRKNAEFDYYLQLAKKMMRSATRQSA